MEDTKFPSATIAEAFRRVVSVIAASDAVNDQAKEVALETLDRVRASLELSPPDDESPPLRAVPSD